MVELINRVAKARRELLQEHGTEPSPEVLSEATGVPAEQIPEIQGYNKEPISLHTTFGDESSTEIGDLIEDVDVVGPWERVVHGQLQDALRRTLADLSAREAGVVSRRYGLDGSDPQTLEEIGQVYGVTRERIRQILAKTMSKLQHPSRQHMLSGFLDAL
jgi:RNA polymerase primary sigma factor